MCLNIESAMCALKNCGHFTRDMNHNYLYIHLTHIIMHHLMSCAVQSVLYRVNVAVGKLPL